MRLDDIRPSVESSGGMKEEFFSIEDQGMIFEILRNKMYSDPIRAICREISCNARDAHREVGTPEKPIQITLPNDLEPFYKVKDWGPGISPDRMVNIFIRYTASTKRADNLQTGGFGLGAKTPFSYSDTFTILTVHNGIEYNYACFIDETKVGKLALFSSSPTDKENGTELIIPVDKYYDYASFKQATYASTKHWDVKPIFKGGTVEYKNEESILSGEGWSIHDEGWNRDTKIIIDGIEYPIDRDELRKFADKGLLEHCTSQIRLYFNVGELTLAANREQVYLDDKTKSAIATRILDMKHAIKSEVETKIKSIPNLWEAQIFFHKELYGSFSNIEFLGDVKWNGIKLVHARYGVRTGCPVYSFKKEPYSDRVNRYNNNGKISFDDKALLIVNDTQLSEPTSRYFKKFFEANPNSKNILLICPTDNKTENDLNKEINLDKMEPLKLSSIISYKGKKKSLRSRLIVFRYDIVAGNFRQVKIDTFDESDKKKVILHLNKDPYNPSIKSVVNTKYTANSSILTSLARHFKDVEFYGVDVSIKDDRIAESLPGCGDYDDFIEKNVIKSGVDFMMVKSVARGLSNGYGYKHNYLSLDYISTVEGLIEDQDSVFKRVCTALRMLSCIAEDSQHITSIYENVFMYVSLSDADNYLIDNPHMDASTYMKELETKYPMISFLSGHQVKDNVNHVADYINMVDKN